MRLKQWFRRVSQRQNGDTLVEVMISIAVISLVLSGAYVTTNRSLQSTRDAQERGDALKLVESQVERLKGLAVTSPTTLFGTGVPSPFCITGTTVVAAANAACKMNAAGGATTTEPAYTVSITKNANTFTVRNSWTSVRGVQNSVSMVYRVYQ